MRIVLIVSFFLIHNCATAAEDITFKDKIEECNVLYEKIHLKASSECYERILSKLTDNMEAAIVLESKALIEIRLKNDREAIKLYEKAIKKVAKEEGAGLIVVRLLAGYSDILIGHEYYDAAEKNLEQAKKIYRAYVEKNGVKSDVQIDVRYQLSYIAALSYFKQNNFQGALKIVNEEINQRQELGKKSASMFMLKSRIEIEIGENIDLREVSRIAKRSPCLASCSEANLILSRFFYVNNQHKKAIKMFNIAKSAYGKLKKPGLRLDKELNILEKLILNTE